MNELDRLNLQKMISTNDVKDCTGEIREKKHSKLIKENVEALIFLKSKYARLSESNPNQFDNMCTSKCKFLFNNYTDIFNRVKKDEIDLNILYNFIEILKKIENNEMDQHEASFLVGKLLKEMYIDSALKKSEKLDKQNKKVSNQIDAHKPKKISYKEYKILQE